MGNSKLPDESAFVNASEIRWLGEPIPPVEQVDLLTLTERELVDYARGLQVETAWLRALLHEALELLHRLTRQLDRSRARVEALVAELRARRRDPPRKVSV